MTKQLTEEQINKAQARLSKWLEIPVEDILVMTSGHKDGPKAEFFTADWKACVQAGKVTLTGFNPRLFTKEQAERQIAFTIALELSLSQGTCENPEIMGAQPEQLLELFKDIGLLQHRVRMLRGPKGFMLTQRTQDKLVDMAIWNLEAVSDALSLFGETAGLFRTVYLENMPVIYAYVPEGYNVVENPVVLVHSASSQSTTSIDRLDAENPGWRDRFKEAGIAGQGI